MHGGISDHGGYGTGTCVTCVSPVYIKYTSASNNNTTAFMSCPGTNNFAEQRLNEEKEDDNAGNEPPLKRVFKDTPYQGNLSPQESTKNGYNLLSLSHLLLSILPLVLSLLYIYLMLPMLIYSLFLLSYIIYRNPSPRAINTDLPSLLPHQPLQPNHKTNPHSQLPVYPRLNLQSYLKGKL
jgi:hypothetical protein